MIEAVEIQAQAGELISPIRFERPFGLVGLASATLVGDLRLDCRIRCQRLGNERDGCIG